MKLSEVMEAERELKATVISDMPHSTDISNPTAQKAEKIIDHLAKQTAKIETNLERYFREKNRIDDLISLLGPRERVIIELRYFNKYEWWQVAHSVNYCKRQCYRYEKDAFEKMLKGVS